MAVSLYDYQKDAVEKLKTGSILCGGVGSGKSRTSLAYFYTKECGGVLPESDVDDYPRLEHPKDLYIITTAKKRDSLEWEKECIPFLLSTDPAISPCKVIVDSWNNIKKYVDVKNAFFIFDEQRIVGSGTWAKSFVRISKKNNWILLSATPGDTWLDYVPVFIANGFYKNRTEFINRHVVYAPYVDFPKVDKYLGTAYLNKLKESILVRMDYKRQAIQHHEWIESEFSDSNYNRVQKDRWDIFSEKPIRNISSLCYLLRKVVNSDPDRIRILESLCSKHPRIIVFYNFNYELEILCEFALTSGIAYAQWNGKKHEQIPEKESWLYFVQYSAGAEGWNCTDTNAIVFFSQNYSYRAITQAAGRIDRLNTPYSDLYYYHLFSDCPIDRAIKNAYTNKKIFNERKFITS